MSEWRPCHLNMASALHSQEPAALHRPRVPLMSSLLTGTGTPRVCAAVPVPPAGAQEVERWYAQLPKGLQQHRKRLLPEGGCMVAIWTQQVGLSYSSALT